MKKIAWIGTGVMGGPMATHLAKAGYPVTVYNRTYEKALKLQEHCTVVKTIKEAVKDADIVFTIVGFPEDVESVYLDDDGILNNMPTGGIVVDMTTSSPTLAKKIYDVAKGKGIFSLDSPVTGGDLGAINATLSIMVGGDEEAFLEVEPAFKHLGSAITYIGGPGLGQHMKLANQICIAGAITTVAEAMNYATAKDIDPEKFLNVVNNGSAMSWQSKNMGPKMAAGNFDPGFFIKHFIKDLRLGQLEKGDLDLSVSALILQHYEELQKAGFDNDGTQAIIKYYQKD